MPKTRPYRARALVEDVVIDLISSTRSSPLLLKDRLERDIYAWPDRVDTGLPPRGLSWPPSCSPSTLQTLDNMDICVLQTFSRDSALVRLMRAPWTVDWWRTLWTSVSGTTSSSTRGHSMSLSHEAPTPGFCSSIRDGEEDARSWSVLWTRWRRWGTEESCCLKQVFPSCRFQALQPTLTDLWSTGGKIILII